MPDPTVSDALVEAYALAPADDVILHTLELRHPLFTDDSGAADSIWVAAADDDVIARIEAAAPVKGGQVVRFTALAFRFSLAPIEPGSVPEITVAIDNVSALIIEQLDATLADSNPITACYRPYLESDLLGGPQMDPPTAFTLSDVKVTVLTVTARARSGIGDALRRAFPRMLYTAQKFPGLIGR